MVYEKAREGILFNPEFHGLIKYQQQISQKDIVYYLNAMKVSFSNYSSAKEILDMNDTKFKQDLCSKVRESF